jgi:hypothetical protein
MSVDAYAIPWSSLAADDVASLGRYETNLKRMHVCMALMVIVSLRHNLNVVPGNNKGESITVLLTSCLTGLD